MPLPPNLTPETALVIAPTSDHYSATLDYVLQTWTGSGYTPPCESGQTNAVWWKVTPSADNHISIVADAATPGTLQPSVSVWTGTPPALTPLVVSGVGFCQITAGGFWVRFPGTAGTTYYIQVVNHNTAALPDAALKFEMRAEPLVDAPTGSVVITNDVDLLPATVLASDAAALYLRYLRLPAGEVADTMPTGEVCLQDGHAALGVAIYDWATQQRLYSYTITPPDKIHAIKSDRDYWFYLVTRASAFSDYHVTQFGRQGQVGFTWTLPVEAGGSSQYAVSRNGNYLYIGNGGGDLRPILVYDLFYQVLRANLHPGFAGEVLSGYQDGYVDVNGNLVLVFQTGFPPTAVSKVRVFSPAGAVLQTLTVSGGGYYVHHFSMNSDSPNAIMLWLSTGYNTDPTKFRVVNLETGATISEGTGTAGSTAFSTRPGEPFAHAASCPLIVSPVPLLVNPEARCTPQLTVSCWNGATLEATHLNWGGPP